MPDDFQFAKCKCGSALTSSDVVRETETEKVAHCIVCDHETIFPKKRRRFPPPKLGEPQFIRPDDATQTKKADEDF
jgi:hypothetical protein